MRWKSWLAFSLLALVLGGLVVGVYGYPYWRQARLVSLARTAMEAGDWRAAALGIREAGTWGAPTADLFRVMADFDFRRRHADALRWRLEALKLEPESVEDRYLLATHGLILGRIELSEEALAGLPPEWKDDQRTWQVRLAQALGRGDLEQGRQLHRQMTEKFGDSDRQRLNLAKLQLLSDDTDEQKQGVATALGLAADKTLGADALRSVVKYEMHHGRFDRAEQLVHRTLAHPKTVASDFLLRLEVYRERQPQDFLNEMRRQLAAVGDDQTSAHYYLNWMMGKGWIDETRELFQDLPPSLREAPVLSILHGQAMVQGGRWATFGETFAQADWAELDFLRLAYLARALEISGAPGVEVDQRWNESVAALGERLDSMELLARTADLWGWGERTVPLWRRLSKAGPRSLNALQQLAAWHRRQREGRPLHDVYRDALRLAPGSLPIQNNYATYSLLLGEDVEAAHQLAERLYREHPEMPAVVGTYAQSLLLRDRADEALAALHQLKDRDREASDLALVEARALVALDRYAAARTVLERVNPDDLVLEEEDQLRKLERELSSGIDGAPASD